MKGIKKPLDCRQGKTFEQPLRFKDKLVDGNIIPLTGYTARMHIRETIESEDILLELTTENGNIVIDEELGKVTLLIDDETTASFEVGNYVYDVELISPSGKVYGPIVPSAFKVKPEVTR